MKKVLIIIATLLTASCAKGYPDLPDGTLDIDAGAFFSDGEEHPCRFGMIGSDFFNCGTCEAACDPRNSDNCFEGDCLCGIGVACGEGADCRAGQCVMPDYRGINNCEFDEDCDVNSACIEGFCTFIECVPEVCDGIDNDCDGIVDGMSGGPLSRWCYSGGETDPRLINSPCRAGAQVCSSGRWGECFGEVSPIPEAGLFACDGIDNNCDLCIDGNMTSTGCEDSLTSGFDIVFAIDQSGSMGPFSSAVIQAVNLFSTVFDRADFNFALVLVPGDTDRIVELRQDLADYTTFVAALTAVDGRSFGASEPSWDAVYEIGVNDLGISFTPGHIRIIILFTDEGGQSYRFPELDEDDICDSLTHGEVFVVFELAEHFEDYNLCAVHRFELNSDYEVMASLLESVISDPCLEE